MKVRQDAWTHEDDLLLATTVLEHIRDGSTQLRAFDEVGDELNRTSAACGFRWNAVVRNHYIKQIADAKKERKERKRAASYSYIQKQDDSWRTPVNMEVGQITLDHEMSLDSVINYLKTLNASTTETNSLERANRMLEQENEQLQSRNLELEKQLQKVKQDTSIIEEDYQSLISIMNRARRMAILEEDDPLTNVSFKMDKNGNLERLAK